MEKTMHPVYGFLIFMGVVMSITISILFLVACSVEKVNPIKVIIYTLGINRLFFPGHPVALLLEEDPTGWNRQSDDRLRHPSGIELIVSRDSSYMNVRHWGEDFSAVMMNLSLEQKIEIRRAALKFIPKTSKLAKWLQKRRDKKAEKAQERAEREAQNARVEIEASKALHEARQRRIDGRDV